jgi:hypothetical protein
MSRSKQQIHNLLNSSHDDEKAQTCQIHMEIIPDDENSVTLSKCMLNIMLEFLPDHAHLFLW